MSRSLTIRLVTPRLEPVSVSGPEVQTGEIARRLSERGHDVEILTTCVRDDVTWKDHYDPGLTLDGDVPLRRFPADPRRLTRGSLDTGWRIAGGIILPESEGERWVRSLGYSSALRDYIAAVRGEVDVFIFSPALSGTTLAGIDAAAGRAILISALPDTPAARLAVTGRILEMASHIVTGSPAEEELIKDTWAIHPDRLITAAAAAVDGEERHDPSEFRRRHGIETPFLLYVGRRTREKGVGRLLTYTASLVQRLEVDFRLVLIGTERIPIPDGARDHVIDLHSLGRREKVQGMAAALTLCQPSAAEGLALAPLETWSAGRPVLADARGAVTAERCRLGGGGITYEGYEEFEEAVRLLLEEGDLATRLGAQGKRWVREEFNWEKTINALEKACLATAAVRAGVRAGGRR